MGIRLFCVAVFVTSLVVSWRHVGKLQATPKDGPPSSIRQALRSGNEKRQHEALTRLATDSQLARKHVGAAARLLSHASPEMRVEAVRAVVAAGDKAMVYLPKLLELMTDEATTGPRGNTIPVWAQAAEAVGTLGKPVVPHLIPWIANGTPLQCRAAAVALHQAGADAGNAAPAIARRLNSGDMQYTLELLHALIGIGPAGIKALPAVLPLLDHDNFHVQYWSCKAIGAMGPAAKAAVPDLARKTGRDASVPSVRRHAALALGKIGAAAGEAGVTALIRLLDDPVFPVREDALTALAQIGPTAKKAGPVLQQKLVEKKLTPVAPALYAYYRITGDLEFVRPRLLARLGGLNARVETLPVLAKMGPDARFALAAVIECARSKDEVVRLLAIEALEKIGVYNDEVLAVARRFAAPSEPDADIRSTAQRILDRAQRR